MNYDNQRLCPPYTPPAKVDPVQAYNTARIAELEAQIAVVRAEQELQNAQEKLNAARTKASNARLTAAALHNELPF